MSPSVTVDLDNRVVAVAARLGRFAARKDLPATSCPYREADAETSALRRVWLANYLRVRPPVDGSVDYSDVEAAIAEADRGRDDAHAAAAAGLLVAWPVIAAPLVDSLGTGAAGGALATLAPAQAAVDAVARGLAERMQPLAAAAASATVADAAAQGATVDQVQPNADRLAEIAAVTAAMLAASLTAVATEAALTAPADGVAEAVRRAVTAAGTAPRGSVATRLRATLSAAEHEGRRAVFEAYPPDRYVAFEEATGACGPCAANRNRVYESLADALADYRGWGGYVRCVAGASRCRGGLRGVWARPVTESAGPQPIVLAEAGSFHLI